MQDLSIEIMRRDDGPVCLQLRGSATVDTTDKLNEALKEVLALRPTRVHVDLSELQFVTSLGLGALVAFRRQATATGTELKLTAANDQIADVLKRTRLAELFHLGTPPFPPHA